VAFARDPPGAARADVNSRSSRSFRRSGPRPRQDAVTTTRTWLRAGSGRPEVVKTSATSVASSAMPKGDCSRQPYGPRHPHASDCRRGQDDDLMSSWRLAEKQASPPAVSTDVSAAASSTHPSSSVKRACACTQPCRRDGPCGAGEGAVARKPRRSDSTRGSWTPRRLHIDDELMAGAGGRSRRDASRPTAVCRPPHDPVQDRDQVAPSQFNARVRVTASC